MIAMKNIFLPAIVAIAFIATGKAPLKAQDGASSPPLPALSHNGFERGGAAPAVGPRPSMLRGYADFSLAPPHNEADPGLCDVPTTVGTTPCTAFARYMLYGHIEMRPLARWPRILGVPVYTLYIFSDATLLLGNNIPQQKYTWSADAIGVEKSFGVVAPIPHGFEVRITQHPPFSSFQQYKQSTGYLGPNGPWGRYTTVGVRKYFGYHGSDGAPR